MNVTPRKFAFRVAVVYFILSSLYIFISDQFQRYISPTGDLQTYKGLLFVVLTSILLYLILRRLSSEIFIETEAKSKLAETLVKTENKYKLLFEKSGEAIFFTNPDGTIYKANPEACRIFGYTEEEFNRIGREGIVDQSDPRLEGYLRQREQKGFFRGELNFRRKDGSIFPAEVSSSIFKDSNDELKTTTTLTDISERIQNEEKINSLLNIMSRMSKMAKIGAWEFDPDTFEGTWTEETARIHDLDPDEPTNAKKGLSFYVGESKQKIMDAIDNLIKNKQSYDLELEMISAKGIKKWVRTIGQPVIENDKVVKVTGSFQDITGEKKIQEKLNHQYFTLRGTIDAIQTPIFSLDRNYCYTSFNKVHAEGMRALYGTEVELGKSLFSYMTIPEDIQKAKKNLDKALAGEFLVEESYSGDVSFSRNYYEISHSPIQNEAGNVIGVSIVTIDLTAQKNNQDLILESEKKYRYLFENNPNPMWVYDLETFDFLAVNNAAISKYGYSKEEFFRMNIYDIRPKEDFVKLKANISNATDVIHESGPWRHKLKNGEIIFVEIISHQIQFSNREARLIIANDITKRLEAEKNIRTLSRGIEQSPAIIIVTEVNGNIKYVNPKFTEVTGYSFEEVKGKNPRFLKSGYTTRAQYQELWETLLEGREWRGEIRNIKKNGKFYWQSTLLSPIFDESNKIINFIAVCEDITKQKETIEELIRAKEKAEEMNRVKSFFFATMSHELRTPFVGIMGYAQLLQESVESPEDKELVEGILETSNRLTDTLTKILDLTKLEFDQPSFKITEFDIVQLIENILAQYGAAAEKKNLSLRKNIGFSSLKIKSDNYLIESSLNNLINNAIKYTDKGYIEVSAELDSTSATPLLTIKIIDTGIGISKDKQDIVWEEFRQVSEGITREFQGSGLGLSIVRKNISFLGGKISLDSNVNIGSTFTIKLPVELPSLKSENAD